MNQDKKKEVRYETRNTWQLVTGWRDCPKYYKTQKMYAKSRTIGGKLNGSSIY